MVYSKYFIHKDRKIPTIFSIGVLFLIILIMARYFGSISYPSKASKKEVKNMMIVSPSHNQVGIFWQTEEKEAGWVMFGQNESVLDKVALDERDTQDRRNLYYNHLAYLKNLEPETQYFYKLVLDNQIVAGAEGTPFTFKSAANISLSANLNPAYGKIIRENGEPLIDAIVLLFLDNSYPLVGVSKATGEWLIPLNTVLAKDQLKPKILEIKEKITLEIFSDDKKRTKVITNLSQVSPLPQTVIIGKNYNFLDQDNVLAETSESRVENKEIEILFPKESAIISGGNPLIKGTGLPGTEVEVTIEPAEKYRFKTRVDKVGIWRIVIPQLLPPGSHVLRVITKDVNEKVIEMTRNFVVAKSGEQVLGEATEEATPTFVPTEESLPTFIPTPTIQIVQSFTPTITLVPGTNVVPIGVASASLIILGLGVLLAF